MSSSAVKITPHEIQEMKHGIKTEQMDPMKDIMVCKYLRDTMERKAQVQDS